MAFAWHELKRIVYPKQVHVLLGHGFWSWVIVAASPPVMQSPGQDAKERALQHG